MEKYSKGSDEKNPTSRVTLEEVKLHTHVTPIFPVLFFLCLPDSLLDLLNTSHHYDEDPHPSRVAEFLHCFAASFCL